MGELKLENKSIVVPGEEIATGMDYIPGSGTYRLGEGIRANRLGLLSVTGRAVKVIPLSGKYIPKKGDLIICRVIDILMTGWRLDTNSAYSAVLPLRDATTEFIQKGADLTKWFKIGDYLSAKIVNVTSQFLVDITTKGPGLRKLEGGRIIKVNPSKVPRIIGKQGSMVSLIKEQTGCRIVVGQNGLIWLQGDPKDELIAVETIRKIERESHIQGLTDRVKAFLEEKKKEMTGE
ncbi:RNA-binding protein [Candidatus Woesearchaeota archaeon]|nr:MAG: RNA-binding protein [Candidatus Woesearchaeota archaeon]